MFAPALALLYAVIGSAAIVSAEADDDWSPKVALRDDHTGDFLAPIHASLMPDGSVMLIGYSQAVEEPPDITFRTGTFTALLVPPAIGEVVPPEMYVTTYEEDLEYDLEGPGDAFLRDTYFCGGHAPMADGTLLHVGGLREIADWPDPLLGTTVTGSGGLPTASTWNHGATAWSRLPVDMVGQGAAGPIGSFFEGPDRYYPTVTRLADGRMLVIGGSQLLGLWISGGSTYGNEWNLSAEVYDPLTGDWTQLSSYAQSPAALFNLDYTHMFVLPTSLENFDVLMLGMHGIPFLMSTTATPRWSGSGPKRPGPDADTPGVRPVHGASSAVLPLRLQDGEWGYGNGAIVVAGGEGDYRDEVDVYDPGTSSWSTELALAVDRHQTSAALLPNGEVVVVCGHDDSASVNLLRQAEYIDPAAGFSRETGSDSSYAVRGYHTITLLLPDGRLLVGGGRLHGPLSDPREKANFELLSPSYLLNPRPAITTAPAEIHYGEEVAVAWTGSVGQAALVSLGSMTHSIDMNQRHVQVELTTLPASRTAPDGTALSEGSLVAPAGPAVAPPGHYLLFLLAPDSDRTPSIGHVLHLGHDPDTGVPASPNGTDASRVALTLSPNPTRGPVFAHLPAGFGSIVRAVAVDVSGRVARSWSAPREARLDLSGLPSGVYFLKMTDEAGRRASGTVSLIR